MALRITISTATAGAPGRDRQTRMLTEGTLSIGRASGNDWVLADPDQHLSRTHCMVSSEDGIYWLTDLSTNGMFVNGAREATSRNSRMALTDGDTVRLGGYMMELEEVASRSSSDQFGAGKFVSHRGSDPFDGGKGGDPLDIDPLDDPLGQALEHPQGAAGFGHPLPHMPPSVRTADPFDAAGGRNADDSLFGRPNGDSWGGGAKADPWGTPAKADPWGGSVQREQHESVSNSYTTPKVVPPVNLNEFDFDALLGDMPPGGAPPPTPIPAGPARPQAPAPAPVDFDDLLGDFPGPDAAPIRPVAPTPAPLIQTPAPPAPAAPPAAPPPAQAPAAAPPVAARHEAAAQPASADGAALMQAFLEGCGLTAQDLPGVEPEAAMRAAGALFRAFVEGTREVLMSRAEIKHEMRVDQTMLRSRDNNALKFSISPQEALLALLRPDRPGYKAPLASVQEAFDDIRLHEMAVMAGMQTGLIALMKRFDPVALEGRLTKGMLDGIVPGARKARTWEAFCTTYKDIAREAEDDFHAVFGRDFAKAYNAQLGKG